MITFYCSNCGTKITAEPEYAGASANCPTCSHDLVVPGQVAQQSTGQTQTSPHPTPDAQSQALPGQAGKDALILVIANKLKGLLSKKWAIPGCAVLGLVLMVSLCTNNSKPEKYDAEAAYGQEAERLQGIMRENDGKPCRVCNGAGNRGRTGCPDCKVGLDDFKGQGTVRTPSGYIMACSRCQGSGTVPLTCNACGGTGNFRSPY